MPKTSADAVGITTTVPVELVFSAGAVPVDLNNIFVADAEAGARIDFAERRGFPQSACAWIKGLYGTVHACGIRRVIGVVEGDCSETRALLEILQHEGVEVIPFAFPHTRRRDDLLRELNRLADALGTTLEAGEVWKRRLDAVRALALELDRLAAERGAVTSAELFSHLLELSDFGGDPDAAAQRLQALLEQARTRSGQTDRLRLGCAGVPTILSDLWDAFERAGARFVYHEVPRQFALVDGIGRDLADAYLGYTYPYDIAARIDDLRRAVDERGLQGIVHYVQSFCHRQLHDRLLREHLTVPVLTVEADRPGCVDERTRTRIEAFCEQLGG